jgi:hypothetical protein
VILSTGCFGGQAWEPGQSRLLETARTSLIVNQGFPAAAQVFLIEQYTTRTVRKRTKGFVGATLRLPDTYHSAGSGQGRPLSTSTEIETSSPLGRGGGTRRSDMCRLGKRTGKP